MFSKKTLREPVYFSSKTWIAWIAWIAS